MSKQNTTAAQRAATVEEAQSRLHAAITTLGEAAARLRELRGQTEVDVTANEIVAALVDGRILDSLTFGASLTVIHSLDPQRQEAARKRQEEESRLAREAEARRAKDPAVIAELRAREVRALELRLASFKAIPTHPRAVEARQRLLELQESA